MRNKGKKRTHARGQSAQPHELYIATQYKIEVPVAKRFVNRWLPKAKRMAKRDGLPVKAALCIIYQREHC